MLSFSLTKLHFLKRSWLRTALFSSLLILMLIPSLTAQDYERIGILSGVTINNFEPLGRIQLVMKVSNKFYFSPGLDLSRVEEAYHGRFIYSPWSWQRLQFHFILGPQIEAVSLEPTQEEQIYYLMSATGGLLSYEFREGIHLVIGFDYLTPNKEVAPWKFGFGLISWF